MRTLLVVCALAAMAGPAAADVFDSPALQCVYGSGYAADWSTGEPKLEPSEFAAQLTFAAINSKARTAQLIGNAGSASVFMMTTAEGLHFLEVTGSGNVNLTTVFNASGDVFPSVHSRHIALSGGPFPSQYHGYCKAMR